MENSHISYALILTLCAGLATCIGSVIALFAKKTDTKLLSFSLGLSAGVMIYVSFVELFAESKNTLIEEFGDTSGGIIAVAALFLGIAIIGVIDFLVPSAENPHESRGVEDLNINSNNNSKQLKRVGILTAIAIGVHNFPEGIATFTTAYQDPTLGLAIAIAVAIHNIPEGIAVSIPIYYATGSRKKAFLYSLLSGVAEPIGGLLAFAILIPFITPTLMGVVLAVVAGIMIYISIDELLPAARKYGEAHTSLLGFIAGMLIMALSLILIA